MPPATSDQAPTRAAQRWLFSPAIDLLAGCGLGYVGIFALLCVAGGSIKEWLPLSLLPLLAIAAGGPHYGATLVRVYETREDRQRYAVVGVGVTLAIALAFVVSLRVYALGSLLITLYFLWSPWHYSAQNYGLARMLLGRRGVPLDPTSARVLRAVFTLPFLIFIVQSNGEGASSLLGSEGIARVSDPNQPLYESMTLGIPASLQSIGLGVLLALYLATLMALGVRLLRTSSMRDLFPIAMIAGSQAVWFALPSVARFWGFGQRLLPLDGAQSLYAFQWIAAAHAAQYLWVTLYFNRRAGRHRSGRRFYLKSLLAGQALWSVPTFVFAPLILDDIAYSSDLVVLVAAVVNLHHFVLDGAIWKLRDPRIRSVLLDRTAPGADAHAPAARPWLLRSLAWGIGTLVLAVESLSIVDRHTFHVAWARADLARAQYVLKRLDTLGRGSPRLQMHLATLAEDAGQPALAIAAFERSAQIQPHPAAYQQLARLHLTRDEWGAAIIALEASRELVPLTPELEAVLEKARERTAGNHPSTSHLQP